MHQWIFIRSSPIIDIYSGHSFLQIFPEIHQVLYRIFLFLKGTQNRAGNITCLPFCFFLQKNPKIYTSYDLCNMCFSVSVIPNNLQCRDSPKYTTHITCPSFSSHKKIYQVYHNVSLVLPLSRRISTLGNVHRISTLGKKWISSQICEFQTNRPHRCLSHIVGMMFKKKKSFWPRGSRVIVPGVKFPQSVLIPWDFRWSVFIQWEYTGQSAKDRTNWAHYAMRRVRRPCLSMFRPTATCSHVVGDVWDPGTRWYCPREGRVHPRIGRVRPISRKWRVRYGTVSVYLEVKTFTEVRAV